MDLAVRLSLMVKVVTPGESYPTHLRERKRERPCKGGDSHNTGDAMGSMTTHYLQPLMGVRHTMY